MIMDIVTVEQPDFKQVLTSKAQAVQFPLSASDSDLITAMKEKLQALGGVGLAAPQVNAPRQIITIYIPEEAALLRDQVIPYPMHVMINPHYQAYDSEYVYDFEACYSVSSKAGKVPRYKTIKLTYQDEQGQHHKQIETGFYARVLQHEIDHLNGLLISDRLTPDCIQGPVKEMMALRRESLSEEKKQLFDAVMAKKLLK